MTLFIPDLNLAARETGTVCVLLGAAGAVKGARYKTEAALPSAGSTQSFF
jgi:hypothetical protein